MFRDEAYMEERARVARRSAARSIPTYLVYTAAS
jgi:hypothetical protein